MTPFTNYFIRWDKLTNFRSRELGLFLLGFLCFLSKSLRPLSLDMMDSSGTWAKCSSIVNVGLGFLKGVLGPSLSSCKIKLIVILSSFRVSVSQRHTPNPQSTDLNEKSKSDGLPKIFGGH